MKYFKSHKILFCVDGNRKNTTILLTQRKSVLFYQRHDGVRSKEKFIHDVTKLILYRINRIFSLAQRKMHSWCHGALVIEPSKTIAIRITPQAIVQPYQILATYEHNWCIEKHPPSCIVPSFSHRWAKTKIVLQRRAFCLILRANRARQRAPTRVIAHRRALSARHCASMRANGHSLHDKKLRIYVIKYK